MKHAILTSLMITSLMTGSLPASAELDLKLPDMNVPDLGGAANSALGNAEETEMGLKMVRKLRGSKPIIEDPELSGWLRALGNRLATQAPGSGNFYFLILKDPSINAYAMSGGVIVIHSGLILNSQSESELAGVMAHEIAHVTQHHIARMMAGKSSTLVTGLGVLAGAAAASKSPDAAQAIITGTMATQLHQQRVFSQQMESEADRVGLRILSSAGFDPKAMPTFLEKLDRRTNDLYGDITQYLRSHPLTIDRISDTRTRANQLAKQSYHEDSDYLYAREKLRALTQPSSPAVTQGNAQLTQYAQAARQLRSGNAQAVLQTLGAQSQHLPTALLIAQALNDTHRYAETEKLLTPLANTYPGQDGILTLLAEALLANKQADQAWQLLSRTQLHEQTSLEFLEIRQRAAEQAGQTIEAYRTAAERSLRMGEYKQASAILEQASRLPGTPAPTQARFQAMAQDIKRTEKRTEQID
jgi:predicted Zn-dependent protease